MSLSAVYDLLHELDYEWLCLVQASEVRPRSDRRFPKKVPEELAKIQAEHPGQQVVVFFQDECRFGQQGTLTRVWAKRGSRPAVRQTEYESLCVIGAASPQTGQAEATLAPCLNTAIINQFLDQFSRALAPTSTLR